MCASNRPPASAGPGDPGRQAAGEVERVIRVRLLRLLGLALHQAPVACGPRQRDANQLPRSLAVLPRAPVERIALGMLPVEPLYRFRSLCVGHIPSLRLAGTRHWRAAATARRAPARS